MTKSIFEARVDSAIRQKRDQITKLEHEITGLMESKVLYDNAMREQERLNGDQPNPANFQQIGVRWRPRTSDGSPEAAWEFSEVPATLTGDVETRRVFEEKE